MDPDLQIHFTELNQELATLKSQVKDLLEKQRVSSTVVAEDKQEKERSTLFSVAAAEAKASKQDQMQEQDVPHIGKSITDLNQTIDNLKQQIKTVEGTVAKLEVQDQDQDAGKTKVYCLLWLFD